MPPAPLAPGIAGDTDAGSAGLGSTQRSAAADDVEVDGDGDCTTELSEDTAVRLPQPAASSDSAAMSATRFRIVTPLRR
jgi:hypothetical protein